MMQLKRTLQTHDLVIMGLLFIGPAAAVGLFGVLQARSGGVVVLVYLLATVVMVCTAYSYAQMAKAIPSAGAVYAYASVAIHPRIGFLVGWMILLDYLLIPAVAYLFSGISLNTIFSQLPVWLWTLLAAMLATLLNIAGFKRATKITLLVLVLELLVLGCIMLAGIYTLIRSPVSYDWLAPLVGMQDFVWSDVLTAVSIAVLSYLGFDAIATFAEEHCGLKAKLGGAMLICLLIAGGLFVLQTYLAALLSPYSTEYLKSHPELQGKAYYDIVNQQLAPILGWSLALMKAIGATFAGMVGQAAAARLLFSMARDKRLPAALTQVGLSSGVPRYAIGCVAVINLGLAVLAAHHHNGLSILVSLVDLGALSAFIALHLSVISYFILRQKPCSAIAYIKYLLLPLLGIVLLIPVLLHIETLAQIVGLLWLLLGLAVLVCYSAPRINHCYPILPK